MNDLPGCIRRELEKVQAEDLRIGFTDADPACQEAIAFHRWAKRKTDEDLSHALLRVADFVLRERTTTRAMFDEAARRLRNRNNPKKVALARQRIAELEAELKSQINARHIEQHVALGYGTDFRMCPCTTCQHVAGLLKGGVK